MESMESGENQAKIAGWVNQLKSGQIKKEELFMELSQLHPHASVIKPNNQTQDMVLQTNIDSSMGLMGEIQEADNQVEQHTKQSQLFQRILEENQVQFQHDACVRKDATAPPTDEKKTKVSVASGSIDVHLVSPRKKDRVGTLETACQDLVGCTFKPKITPLPAQYGQVKSTNIPFHERVVRWKQQREEAIEKKRLESVQSELAQCSFVPTISSNSLKAVAQIAKENAAAVKPITERLYEDADKFKLRDELGAEAQRRREEEMQLICTFKPSINKMNKALQVTSRYRDPQNLSRSAPSSDMEKCTFKPETNNIRRDMQSARLYVQTNIFDRLSHPPRDNLSYSASSNDGSDDDGMIFSEGALKQSNQTEEKKNTRQPTKLQKEKQFQQFLMRQEKTLQAKEDSIRRIITNQSHTGYPLINESSKKMIQMSHKGDFMERLAKTAMKREYQEIKKKAQSKPEFTFQPNINKVSAERPARSVTELSRGDMLKRETNQRLIKLKIEQDEMQQLTFKPHLNPNSLQSKGKIRVISEPESYIERVQQDIQNQKEKSRIAQLNQEKQEISNCTFKPEIHEAPAYISRIAQSMAIAKQQKVSKVKEKPQWK